MLIPAAAVEPRFVISPDGSKIATYEWGDESAPAVIAVHGFASSAVLNWQVTGWVRDLNRAGFRVIAFDQRGHGSSDKPHDPTAYSMEILISDLLAVVDTYMIDEVGYLGYSLGSRVGWQAALEMPERITRAVLGGMPDGDPFARFHRDQALAFSAKGTAISDWYTQQHLAMIEGVSGNDLSALLAFIEGMTGGVLPDVANPPVVPILFVTGGDDPIIEASRSLAAATPHGSFLEIPGRNHFNAPTAKLFRDATVKYLLA